MTTKDQKVIWRLMPLSPEHPVTKKKKRADVTKPADVTKLADVTQLTELGNTAQIGVETYWQSVKTILSDEYGSNLCAELPAKIWTEIMKKTEA